MNFVLFCFSIKMIIQAKTQKENFHVSLQAATFDIRSCMQSCEVHPHPYSVHPFFLPVTTPSLSQTKQNVKNIIHDCSERVSWTDDDYCATRLRRVSSQRVIKYNQRKINKLQFSHHSTVESYWLSQNFPFTFNLQLRSSSFVERHVKFSVGFDASDWIAYIFWEKAKNFHHLGWTITTQKLILRLKIAGNKTIMVNLISKAMHKLVTRDGSFCNFRNRFFSSRF